MAQDSYSEAIICEFKGEIEAAYPNDGMKLGLENLKVYALAQFAPSEAKKLVPYFDHLIEQMIQFTLHK